MRAGRLPWWRRAESRLRGITYFINPTLWCSSGHWQSSHAENIWCTAPLAPMCWRGSFVQRQGWTNQWVCLQWFSPPHCPFVFLRWFGTAYVLPAYSTYFTLTFMAPSVTVEAYSYFAEQPLPSVHCGPWWGWWENLRRIRWWHWRCLGLVHPTFHLWLLRRSSKREGSIQDRAQSVSLSSHTPLLAQVYLTVIRDSWKT